jgi:hypothetical protein
MGCGQRNDSDRRIPATSADVHFLWNPIQTTMVYYSAHELEHRIFYRLNS